VPDYDSVYSLAGNKIDSTELIITKVPLEC